MLTFKNTVFAFLAAVILLITLHFTAELSLWWLAVPLLLFKAAIVYGAFTIGSGFFLSAYTSATGTAEKKIALTFDDGPHPEFTPQVLDLLESRNATATFFVIGKNIAGNEAILQRTDANGHLIGNHTFSHGTFIDMKLTDAFADELATTEKEVQRVTGRKMNYFRPPYGVTTPHIAKAVRRLGYRVIGWNVRSFDTTSDSAEVITRRIQKKLAPGSIVLMHDTSAKSLQVLKETLDYAAENGFKIVSTEELLNLPAYKS